MNSTRFEQWNNCRDEHERNVRIVLHKLHNAEKQGEYINPSTAGREDLDKTRFTRAPEASRSVNPAARPEAAASRRNGAISEFRTWIGRQMGCSNRRERQSVRRNGQQAGGLRPYLKVGERVTQVTPPIPRFHYRALGQASTRRRKCF